MKGGMESGGATSFDPRFFNPNSPLNNYTELSGNGVNSAYGQIESNNIGVGMLAPYTSSTSSSANHSTLIKTGGGETEGSTGLPQRYFNPDLTSTTDSYILGNDLKTSTLAKYSANGGKRSGPIPSISDAPIVAIESTFNGAIDGFTKFMKNLQNNYQKSIDYAKSIKIGNQRLLGGGKKSTVKPKKVVPKKETDKKCTVKPKKVVPKKETDKKCTVKPKKVVPKKKMKGGDGSDWAASQGSRGPVNAPDDYWGVSGEQWFRQFNKTGDYIPNSKLPVSTTPLLAGKGDSNIVSGYDEFGTNYGKAEI